MICSICNLFLSINTLLFYFRHQQNSSEFPTPKIINSEKDSKGSVTDNTRHTRHSGGAKGDKFSKSNKDVTEDNSTNGINKDKKDVQLIVPNYTVNTEGLLTRNVNVTVKMVSMATN